MFGDPREMELHYFLGDDTIEILEKVPPNSGRDAVSVFLRRSRLPKEPLPVFQPGVQTHRTVLNVFGPTGHGGRYLFDSLKVHTTGLPVGTDFIPVTLHPCFPSAGMTSPSMLVRATCMRKWVVWGLLHRSLTSDMVHEGVILPDYPTRLTIFTGTFIFQ